MRSFQSVPVRNRLLGALGPEDFALLAPKLERIPTVLHATIIAANSPIDHVVFPESGIVSTIANTEEGRIEIGVIGSEGMVGLPVVLGTDRTPHSSVVQASGEALRIRAEDLRAAIRESPSVFRPFGLYTQALIVQIAQTAYVNVTFDIEARLARWLLMMQDRIEGTELPLTHDFLAAMLGVRRPGVTMATHVLEGTGAIRARRGRIEIRDREKLAELAGDSYLTAEREYERLMAEI
jgi:CRP-like cAMP-binding protein